MNKTDLMTYCAVAAIGVAIMPTAFAADQTPDEPAGTEYAPTPTVQEEIVYMRDVIALQTLRLDQAEQSLAQQSALIDAQAAQIATLSKMMSDSQNMMASLGAGTTVLAASYKVKSGDTLSQIARKYDTSLSALASANNLKSPYRLKVGQGITVPGAAPAIVTHVAQAPVQAPTKAPEAEQKIASAQAAEPAPKPQRIAQSDNTAGERPDVTQRALKNEEKPKRKEKQENTPEAVGVRPEDQDESPYLAVFSDVGGILTPKGTLFVEPSVSFSVSSDNRFFFQGVEIADAILIGQIEATDSDRRSITESLSFRYGVTNRLEIDGRIANVNRNDRVSGIAVGDGTSTFRDLSGSGIGDTDIGVHYQLTNGKNFPYTVLNVRGKAPTGLSPFDVARDTNGVETELPTGSGFWTVEPSLSMIFPTSPAVIFANVGYQMNMATSPNQALGPNVTLLEFDPGDALRTSIGVGLSLNEKLSLNFGYDQSHFFQTRSTVMQDNIRDAIDANNDGQQDILRDSGGQPVLDNFGQNIPLFAPARSETRLTSQPATTVGSFLFGGSYAVTNNFRLNLNAAFGATDEAPDMTVSLKAQYKLFD